MQPTYLPWSGFFALMSYVDKFIILDTVQFSKRSWQHRNKIKSLNGELMLTVPVKSKGLREQKINEVQIDLSTKYNISHTKSIEQNYKKTRFYCDYSNSFNNILINNNSNLVDLNIEIINYLKDILKIKTEVIRSSELNSFGIKDELLLSLCKELGASHYISPAGSAIYMEKSKAFKESEISFSYFQYNHPEYNQLYGDFIPYMSTIDLIFNEGEISMDIIKTGIEM